MCICVQYAPLDALVPYDAVHRIVCIPADLRGTSRALPALRRVLAALDIPQPDFGARCWCGEPVRILSRVPQQRRSGQEMVTRHGA